MTRFLVTFIAAAGLIFAQPKTDEPAKTVTKIIQVHYVNVSHLQNLVSIPGASVKSDAGMEVLVVTGSPDTVAAIEEMVKKLDVAPPPPPPHASFELTGYLLSGSSDPKKGSDEVPAELSGVLKQLHSVFQYKSYRVTESFVLRGRDQTENEFRGDSSSSGMLPGTNSRYNLSFRRATVSDGTPKVVHLQNLDLTVITPMSGFDKDGKPIERRVGFRSDVDVPVGQKVVVGKSNVTGSDDALILVLTAKVVE